MSRQATATVLDQLTAPTVTPAILRVRGAYWRTVADRNERNGRAAQAQRLRVNCDAMEQQAREMESGAVVSIVAPASGKAPRKAPARRTMDAARFWDLHAAAVRGILAVHGGNWKCTAPFGETILVSVPTRLRSYRGPRGGMIRWGRDHRMPAAKYWPDGILPDGLELQADHPREADIYQAPGIRKELERAIGQFKNVAADLRWLRKGTAWQGVAPRDQVDAKRRVLRMFAGDIRALRTRLAEAKDPPPRDDAWWTAHGCVLRNGQWLHRLEAQLADALDEHRRMVEVQRDLDQALAAGLIGEEFSYSDAA